MKLLLFAYIGGALYVAIRLGWHMRYELDAYDWHFKKAEHWFDFFLSTLLWPLLALKPQSLIHPERFMANDEFGMINRRRERDRLRHNLPPCGELILYRPACGSDENNGGEFLFQAADIEQILKDDLNFYPYLSNSDDSVIFNWIRKRSKETREPTEVPHIWDRFEFVAIALVQKGQAEVTCLECKSTLRKKDLIITESHVGISCFYDQLVCPEGHILLDVETTHICF
ncbi:MAG: hypothetical protein IIA05_06035 [Proteobacteria bacterium]|nr:hypothetical protein [Pseudomonadota bacterium]